MKIQRLLRRKVPGEMYVDVLVTVLVVMMLLSIMLIVMPVFIFKLQLNSCADKILRTAELAGSTSDNAVIDMIAGIQIKSGICFDSVSWDGTVYDHGTNVQLGDEINLKITATYKMGSSVFGEYPLAFHSSATGTSEVYYK